MSKIQKMKGCCFGKNIVLLVALVAFLACLGFGCANKDDTKEDSNDMPVAPAIIIEEQEEESPPPEKTPNYDIRNPMCMYLGDREDLPPPTFDVDIDFAGMRWEEFTDTFYPITLVYPEDYLGTTMRIIGTYSRIYMEDFEKEYHYVLVDDELGCCQQYVEFVWIEGMQPDELPEEMALINISGEWKSYLDEIIDWTIYYLEVGEISFVEGGVFPW